MLTQNNSQQATISQSDYHLPLTTEISTPTDECDSANQCRSVSELPPLYQQVFSSSFSKFNVIQSKLFDFLLNQDKSLVICSPTGSGKTVLLELAIVRELIKLENSDQPSTGKNGQPFQGLHVLYLAPLKAIVEEKCAEWAKKFGPFGIKCFALTGDTDQEDYNSLQVSSYMGINIILATPEKFDHIIRTDSKSRVLLRLLQLVLIDEIHMLSDKSRGDVLEATITRIKTLRNQQSAKSKVSLSPLRFIAISATAPNVSEIASWLDAKNSFGFTVSSNLRPVRLDKIVLGYEASKSSATSEYRFDIQLTYHLENVIRTHANRKPCLVFCSTRKSVEFTAKTLSSAQLTFFESADQRAEYFYEISKLSQSNFDMYSGNSIDHEAYFKNITLKTCLQSGVGFYHSGLDYSDRRLLEQLFVKCLIPVLVSTSCLAMGVNLPAHLVIIKNTVQYSAGTTCEYDTSQILQMLGRAGRPQFDTSAKAIIMTRNDKKKQYEALLNSEKVIESSLAPTLAEQLTVEIVLRTVTDMDKAVDWIAATFMFIRVLSNPTFYGSDVKPGDFNGAIPFIYSWCQKTIGRLSRIGLITLKGEEQTQFDPTYLARIVTRQSVSLSTTERLLKILTEGYNLRLLLEQLCVFREMCSDVILRVADKKFLNEYNKKIRFRFKGAFKTNVAKINCLLQATFQCLNIDPSLFQDATQIIKRGMRISKCLVEICLYLCTLSDKERSYLSLKITKLDMYFDTIISAINLMKAFRAKLWHDSEFVSRQLSKIGPVLSSNLVERGYNSFDKLLNANPRDIEFALHRNPPFGSYLLEEIKSLPKYRLNLTTLDQNNNKTPAVYASPLVQFVHQIQLQLSIEDRSLNNLLLNPKSHFVILVIGCQQCDQVIFMHRFSDESLQLNGTFCKKIHVVQSKCQPVPTETPESTDESQSSKYDRVFDANSQAISGPKPKAKSKKANKPVEPEKPKPRRVHTDEFLRLIEDLNANKHSASPEEPAIHAAYANQKCHTIEAMVISESFVGIDMETSVTVGGNTRSVIDISSKPRASLPVQSTLCVRNNQLALSVGDNSNASCSSSVVSSFSNSSLKINDDELMELLDDFYDDFDDFDFSDAIKSQPSNQSIKEEDRSIVQSEIGTVSEFASSEVVEEEDEEEVCYSQFEDPAYVQTNPPVGQQHQPGSSLLDWDEMSSNIEWCEGQSTGSQLSQQSSASSVKSSLFNQPTKPKPSITNLAPIKEKKVPVNNLQALLDKLSQQHRSSLTQEKRHIFAKPLTGGSFSGTHTSRSVTPRPGPQVNSNNNNGKNVNNTSSSQSFAGSFNNKRPLESSSSSQPTRVSKYFAK